MKKRAKNSNLRKTTKKKAPSPKEGLIFKSYSEIPKEVLEIIEDESGVFPCEGTCHMRFIEGSCLKCRWRDLYQPNLALVNAIVTMAMEMVKTLGVTLNLKKNSDQ